MADAIFPRTKMFGKKTVNYKLEYFQDQNLKLITVYDTTIFSRTKF